MADVLHKHIDYLDYWLEHYCKEFLAHRTVEEYSVIANKYLKPGLGHFRLNEITSNQLNMYLIELELNIRPLSIFIPDPIWCYK